MPATPVTSTTPGRPAAAAAHRAASRSSSAARPTSPVSRSPAARSGPARPPARSAAPAALPAPARPPAPSAGPRALYGPARPAAPAPGREAAPRRGSDGGSAGEPSRGSASSAACTARVSAAGSAPSSSARSRRSRANSASPRAGSPAARCARISSRAAGLVQRVGVRGGPGRRHRGGRLADVQRGRRGQVPGGAQQPLGVQPDRPDPVRVRLAGEHLAAAEQRDRAPGGGQRERRLAAGGPVPRGAHQPGRLVQVDAAGQQPAQPVPGPAAGHRVRAERRPQPADQGGDVVRGPQRRLVRPEGGDQPVGRQHRVPVHREHGQQRARLPAAHLGRRQRPAGAHDGQRADQPQRPAAGAVSALLARHTHPPTDSVPPPGPKVKAVAPEGCDTARDGRAAERGGTPS